MNVISLWKKIVPKSLQWLFWKCGNKFRKLSRSWPPTHQPTTAIIAPTTLAKAGKYLGKKSGTSAPRQYYAEMEYIDSPIDLGCLLCSVCWSPVHRLVIASLMVSWLFTRQLNQQTREAEYAKP